MNKFCLLMATIAVFASGFIFGDFQEVLAKEQESRFTLLEKLDAELLKKKVRESADPYVSNGDDKERRKALEEKFNIKLDETDTWADKHLEDPAYTSHIVLKELGFYGLNASRQELIKFGIRTGDWQPYRAFEAIRTPAYFEFIDGKFEYNKVFYGHLIERRIRGFNTMDREAQEKYKESFEKRLAEDIADFNKAPGIVPYVIGLNHNEADAKQYGVEQPDKFYFNSHWNHPDVKQKGVFGKEANNDVKSNEEV